VAHAAGDAPSDQDLLVVLAGVGGSLVGVMEQAGASRCFLLASGHHVTAPRKSAATQALRRRLQSRPCLVAAVVDPDGRCSTTACWWCTRSKGMVARRVAEPSGARRPDRGGIGGSAHPAGGPGFATWARSRTASSARTGFACVHRLDCRNRWAGWAWRLCAPGVGGGMRPDDVVPAPATVGCYGPGRS
jgi:hypothetical protein